MGVSKCTSSRNWNILLFKVMLNISKKKFFLLIILSLYKFVESNVYSWIADSVLLTNYPEWKKWPSNFTRVEVDMNVIDLIKAYGYPAENHTVQTIDGYILTLHRIPHSKTNTIPGTPILLLHGLGCHSGLWVSNGLDSLAFVLSDDIYDVWMINFRGNPYSRHVYYSSEEIEYWDFSWEDHAEYDLATAIDYILQLTKYPKLLKVSVSMGTTVALALLSSKEYYNDKVAGLVALAPVGSQAYLSTIAMLPTLNNDPLLELIYKINNKPGPIGSCPINPKIMLALCPATDPFFCEMLYSLNVGYSPKLYNRTREPLLQAQCCYGTSVKNAVHYAQMRKLDSMARFDYGILKNVIYYGRTSPPNYYLQRITTPVAMFYDNDTSTNHIFSLHHVARKLKNLFTKVIYPHKMGMKDDFLWLNTPRSNLFDKMLSVLNLMWV